MGKALKSIEQGEEICRRAQEILKGNIKEDLIMPDSGYYEGTWLWDTGFIELGDAYFNPEKAAERLSIWLSKAQWGNGFLPHILFFPKKTERYFPGPEYWRIEKSKDRPKAETSGITQPPVLGFCALRVFENLKEKSPERAKQFLQNIYPQLLEYHRYLFRERDPEDSGLVSIYHPWESGLDNSPRWEEPLAKIPATEKQVKEIRSLRRDVRGLKEKLKNEGLNEEEAGRLAREMRPTDNDYARYLYLVRFAAERNYDDKKIYSEIPFNVKDVLFNSVLYVSNEALWFMAHKVGDKKGAEEIKDYLKKQKQEFKKLYDKETGLFYDLDAKTGKLIKRKTIASFAPLFAGIPTLVQAQRMAEIARGPEFKGKNPLFLLPSTARTDPSFHQRAYWRGPVWMPVNWLVLRGFERMGLFAENEEITKSLLQLVFKKGFYEYYHPDTNEGLGRKDFSWTASLAIDLLKEPSFWKKFWKID